MTREEAIKVMENVKSIFVTEYYKNRFQEAVNSLSCPIFKNYKDEKPEEGVEVIAFNKAWIDKDFNPNGTRIGFLDGNGEFASAYWWDYQDAYITISKSRCDENKEFYSCHIDNTEPEYWMSIPKFFKEEGDYEIIYN